MRTFIWKGHESDTFAKPAGSLRAVEVALFPSGHSIVRWFYPLGSSLHFDLLLHPDWDDIDEAGDAATLELKVDGSSVKLAAAPAFFILDPSPLELGEVRWFVEYLGGKFLIKDWSHRGSSRAIRAIKSARAVSGTITLESDELEVFRLLGEPSPLLWSDEEFKKWAEDRSA